MAEKKERLESEGHGSKHRIRIQKVLAGKPRIFLVEGCKRCEEIRVEREGGEKIRQAMAPGRLSHPDFGQRLRELEDDKNCTIVRNKNGTFYDITAPDGGNIRISTGKMNKKQKEEFTSWLSEHNL